ncbi:MAG: hypothetical protein E6K12_07115 [Methanobacteriota archaeon]|nr:MAG: hypothetical protein E6K12_07115 [Euryarchaeota archaeon]
MLAQHRRIVLVLAISAAVVLSIGAGAILLLRPSVEMRVTDVGMVPDSPQVGMTEVHVQLILRNVGSSQAHFAWFTLFAYDPTTGSLFETWAHMEVRLNPGETWRLSGTANVTGHPSGVAFTMKLFPSQAPSWETSLEPDRPVTWTG